jgi:uncharacterized protein (TIGR04255 family)
MGKKMKNAPVYFTVVQVRFNPVLNIESYLPAIQERMRGSHFPDFKQTTMQQLIIQHGSVVEAGQPPKPSIATSARCIFGSMDRNTEFVLENNALALQTTAYETSDTFFRILLDGLTIIHDVLHLEYTERIGLRYLDAVLPKVKESLSAYLTPGVLGLGPKLEGKLAHSYSETITLIKNGGQLVSRVIIQDGRVGLPFEIAATLAPNINPKFTASEDRHAIIDTDAFCEQRETFELAKIGKKLAVLHTEIENAFRATVTPFALKAWA